jgi:hypothetical protein
MFVTFSLLYSIDMIELLHACGFDTLEYSWVKATIGICTLADYSVSKKLQQAWRRAPKAARKGASNILRAHSRGR